MARPKAGAIVIVDWRGDVLPKEPNKLRPAIVIEDDTLFSDDYPNITVVPLTESVDLAVPGLAVAIDPTAANGCSKRCFALAPYVTAASLARVRPTDSVVTDAQLAEIRRQVAEAIGLG